MTDFTSSISWRKRWKARSNSVINVAVHKTLYWSERCCKMSEWMSEQMATDARRQLTLSDLHALIKRKGLEENWPFDFRICNWNGAVISFFMSNFLRFAINGKAKSLLGSSWAFDFQFQYISILFFFYASKLMTIFFVPR